MVHCLSYSPGLIGEDIEHAQDTPVATQREGSYIIFGVPVEIQKPVEEIPQGGCGVSCDCHVTCVTVNRNYIYNWLKTETRV